MDASVRIQHSIRDELRQAAFNERSSEPASLRQLGNGELDALPQLSPNFGSRCVRWWFEPAPASDIYRAPGDHNLLQCRVVREQKNDFGLLRLDERLQHLYEGILSLW